MVKKSKENDGDNTEVEGDAATEALLSRRFNEIKNKKRRSELYGKFKILKKKLKIRERKKRQKLAKALGDKAPPKNVPRTIENTRVPDETMVDPQDEEVLLDESMDEMATYFKGSSTPKVLITTTDRPRYKTTRLCTELNSCIPNSHVYYRRGLALKKIIPQAVSRDYTDLIVINEDRQTPNGLLLCHLPDGPTAHFKLTSVRFKKEIPNASDPTEHYPEAIINNFNTRLGRRIGRMIASIFPQNPNFKGRQVVTFHNQRDFVFFRRHRYVFRKKGERAYLQELGPRLTLKLRSLQAGTFDSKYGEYEWFHKRHEMETSRRKFFI